MVFGNSGGGWSLENTIAFAIEGYNPGGDSYRPAPGVSTLNPLSILRL